MLTYLIRRILLIIPTLLLITIVTFFIVKLAPGNPMSITSSEGAIAQLNPAEYQQMLHRYGLDKPLHVQYLLWIKNLLSGNFGDSFIQYRPVTSIILERLPNTIILNIVSIILIFIIAVPSGLYSAIKQNSLFDQITGVIFYMLYSLPNFWIAILLIMFLGVRLNLLPFIGMESDNASNLPFWQYILDRINHLILPVICESYAALAFISRFVRGNLLEVIRQDYIRTARAKGLGEKDVLFRHALRNAMIPLLTLFGLILPGLIAGSVIIESIFSWPGLGLLYITAIYTRDYPIIMALSFFSALIVLASNLLTDIMYGVADPRIKYD